MFGEQCATARAACTAMHGWVADPLRKWRVHGLCNQSARGDVASVIDLARDAIHERCDAGTSAQSQPQAWPATGSTMHSVWCQEMPQAVGTPARPLCICICMGARAATAKFAQWMRQCHLWRWFHWHRGCRAEAYQSWKRMHACPQIRRPRETPGAPGCCFWQSF